MHNELIPGLVVPAAFHGTFRKRLAEVASADSRGHCRQAQARAEGLIEALENLTQGIAALHIERLYLLVESTAMARLIELEQGEGE